MKYGIRRSDRKTAFQLRYLRGNSDVTGTLSILFNLVGIPIHFANSIAGFSNALNSIALPQGSRKNMVACSPA